MKPKVLYQFPNCAGQPFRPSNGTEGMIFTDAFCDRCIHEKFTHTGNDKDKMCDILNATMAFGINDKEYPSEWQFDSDGWPTCTKWQKWDWGRDDDGNFNDPPPPEPYDPHQLMMPFDIWDLLGISDEIIVTKTAIVERELFDAKQ